MSIGCVILAAGASTRLGQPKQLVRIGDETLLERAVRIAKEAGCRPVIVVLGANSEELLAGCMLGDVEIIINSGWAEGMGGSIRVGAGGLPEQASAAIVMTCDQPAVTAAHLRRLMELYPQTTNETPTPVASRYAGRNGVPACFPAAIFPELMRLEGDQGARGLLEGARWVTLLEGELDVDTPDALEHALRQFGQTG